MTPDCIPDESLAALVAPAARDGMRVHLAHCPRCRARLASFLSFLEAEDVAGADPDDADARLAAVLRRRQPAGGACRGLRWAARLAAPRSPRRV